MKTKILWITSLMMVLLMSIAYGACTFSNPGASDVLKGSELLNASCTDAGTKNCTITITSASSGSSVATVILLNYTDSGNNATWASTGVNDASDYVFAGSCSNGTTLTLTSRTGITVDNTAPVCTFVSKESGKEYKDDATWTITGTYGTSGTITFGSNAAITLTESSDTFTSTTKVPQGIYTVNAAISDGYNSTSCELTYVRIVPGDRAALIGAAAVATVQQDEITQQEQQKSQTTTMLIIIAAAAVILFKKKLFKK